MFWSGGHHPPASAAERRRRPERPVLGLRAAGQPLSGSHRRRGAGDGRRRLGARRSVLRHCAPLRSRPVGTAPRRGPGVPSARCVRDLLEGRAAARAHRERRGTGRRRLSRARHAPSRVGLQPRRDTPLAHGEPGAARPRSGRHRLPPRPGRALDGSARDRLPGARRTARPGRREGHRRRNEPGVDARRPRT